jgi:hypothetical protein
MAKRVQDVLADTGVVISCVSIFGNPLEQGDIDLETLKGWEQLIDHAHLFGTNMVSGFTGRLRGKPIPESIPRFKKVFGEYAHKVVISSTKSMLGHAMGASGSIEALICVQTILNNIIPPTINYETPDPTCDLDYTPNHARKMTVNVTLSNSFGLGGQNACLIIKRYQE